MESSLHQEYEELQTLKRKSNTFQILAMNLNRHFSKAGIQLESSKVLTYLVIRGTLKLQFSDNLSAVAMDTNNDKRHDDVEKVKSKGYSCPCMDRMQIIISINKKGNI